MTQTTSRPLPTTPTEPEPARARRGARMPCGRARAAQPGWRATSPGERAGHLRAAASAVRAASDELGDLLCTTTGRLLGEARDGARVAADLLDEAAVTGLVGGRALAGSPGALDIVRTEPRGVVGVITPWNDPYPAAAGCSRPPSSPATRWCTSLPSAAPPRGRGSPSWSPRRCPTGVLELVEGDAGAGAALAAHPGVDLVAHIGSSVAGASVRVACAARGAAAVTENGGKDALLVDAGVDPAWAAEQIAVGAFTNAGQLCTSVERVYLHADVADAVLAELVRRAESLVRRRPARALDHDGRPRRRAGARRRRRPRAAGAARGRAAAHRGQRAAGRAHGVRTHRAGRLHRRDARHGGGDLRAGGGRSPWSTRGRRRCERAGGGRYGLAATVLTPDTAHALAAIEALEVGTVKVNAVFGGAPGGSADPRRDSGRGAGYGPDLLREMVVLKAVHWEPAPAPRGA